MNAEQAGIVYSDANILIDSTGEKSQAIWIRDGKIAAIGSNQDVIETAGPSVKNISVAGATITPGLIDTHPHILHFSAYSAALVDLSEVRNHGEIVALIRERASKTPKGEWIVTTPIGEGSFYVRRSWQDLEEGSFPDRHVLDQGSTDHPIMIQAWAPRVPNTVSFNTVALEVLDIKSSSPDPTSKVWIDRDASGHPTGIFTGSVIAYYNFDPYWGSMVKKLPPLFTPELVPLALIQAMKKANANGITAVWEGHAMFDEEIELYKSLDDQSLLTLRGYLDPWGNITRGSRSLTDEQLQLICDFAAANNFRINMCCGNPYDLQELINKAEDVKKRYNLKKVPWIIQHGIMEEEHQPAKLAELGIDHTISLAFTFGKGDMYRDRLGRQVLPMLNPLRSLLDAGVTTAASSDWGPSNPWEQMQLAVTHIMYPSGVSNAGPRQVVTREQAFWMWTSGAKILRWEEMGSLQPGKNADLIIIDRNPITCPLDQLPDTKVHKTIIGGRVVHDDGRF
ncbi:amidohydrolase family-domain-containing protein [Rhexocercosporidium sp. MPI-PUGE-AT-0058]|nr:amidohydrolase family-domain-containing protein [Rhexocercosporidium sp. MPI-PUGE-AT-0058]